MNGTCRKAVNLARVIVPNEDGVEMEISEKLPMEAALLQAYEVNLTQANTTPCMISPLKEKLGPCATWECARNSLLGKIQLIEGVDETTMEVLRYLALKEE